MIQNIKSNLYSPSLGSLCILFLFFLSVLVPMVIPTVANAKNPYQVHRAVEGDPGDGVLGPADLETEDPLDTEDLFLVSAPLPTKEFRRGFRFPMVILFGSDHTPLVLWLPVSNFSHRLYEATRIEFRANSGRGW